MATVQQVLATLGVDSVNAVAVSDDFLVILRNPEPGDVDVSASSTIYLRVVELAGDPSDPTGIIFNVYVDDGSGEALAFNSSAIQSPWDGAASSIGESDASDPYCFREVTLDQAPNVFGSEQLVTVRVALSSTESLSFGHFPFGHAAFGHPLGGTVTGEFTYSFTAEDTEAPNLLSAQSTAAKTVELTFDDTMGTGALSASSYTIEAIVEDLEPAVSVVVTAVATEDSETFVLSLDREMTAGATYQVTVAGAVEDESGNAISTRVAEFSGYQYDVPASRFFDYWRMMPLKNRQEDHTGDLRRFANCIQETLGQMLWKVDHFTDQFDPDLCTDDQIDLMLYDLGNPFEWAELELTANQKRKLLRYLVEIYQSKGTDPGIENAIFFLLGIPCEVVAYRETGWVLGVDELGESTLATIRSTEVAPYDFSGVPLDLEIEVDGVVQSIDFSSGDFATASAATAEEVADAINSQLTGAEAFVDVGGTGAGLEGALIETFSISGGEELVLTVNGVAHTIVFHASDFALSGDATAEEVVARINAEIGGIVVAENRAGYVYVTTLLQGAEATISDDAGSVATALGFPGTEQIGTDAARVNLFSTNPESGATIAVTGGTAQDIIGFGSDLHGGVGGSILSPERRSQLYSFDLEVLSGVTDEEETLMRKVAEYMKPAETHLVNIRTQPEASLSEFWDLGIDSLDEDASLA